MNDTMTFNFLVTIEMRALALRGEATVIAPTREDAEARLRRALAVPDDETSAMRISLLDSGSPAMSAGPVQR